MKTESIVYAVKKGLSIGLPLASGYTGAYMVTKKSGCSHAPAEDPIMRIVRGVTGAIVGGAIGKIAFDYIFVAVPKKEEEDE